MSLGRWWPGHLPPGNILVFFAGIKTQVFAPFATNGNTKGVKIALISRKPMRPMMVSVMDAICWDLGN